MVALIAVKLASPPATLHASEWSAQVIVAAIDHVLHDHAADGPA